MCWLRPLTPPRGEQSVEVDSEAHDLSFMHAFSHDGTEMRELQQADPDINQILDWMGISGSQPPKGWIRGSSRWLQKLWTEYPCLSVVDGLLCRLVRSPLTGEALCQVVVPLALFLMCCSICVGALHQHISQWNECGNVQGELVAGPSCSKIFNSGVNSASHVKPARPRCQSIVHI